MDALSQHQRAAPLHNTAKKHVRTEPSMCWQHFVPTRNERQQITFTTCKICKKTYKYNHSTTNMMAHLRCEHGIFKQQDHLVEQTTTTAAAGCFDPSQQQTVSPSLPTSSSSLSSGLPRSPCETTTLEGSRRTIKKNKYNTQKAQRISLLLKFIILTDQALSLVDNIHFKNLVGSLCDDSDFRMPCAKTLVRNLIPQSVVDVKRRLQEELSKVSWCAITCDCWRSLACESYIGITCHYINDQFKLISRTLGLVYLDGQSHTAEYLHTKLAEFFRQWNIDTKVTASSFKVF
jgi:hypothetical protein